MKKFIVMALIALCALPAMTSCSGDDEPDGSGKNLPFATRKLVGLWCCYSYTAPSGYLALFANGKCMFEDIKGEWAYDAKTKMLSTTVGVQAIITESTDEAWEGNALTGAVYSSSRGSFEYIFGYDSYDDSDWRKELHNMLYKGWSNAMASGLDLKPDDIYNAHNRLDYYKELAAHAWYLAVKKAFASDSELDDYLDDLAREDLAKESPEYVIGADSMEFSGDMNTDDWNEIRLLGSYDYYDGAVTPGHTAYRYSKQFTIAKGKIDMSLAYSGYKAKITVEIPHKGNKTYEVIINPFE